MPLLPQKCCSPAILVVGLFGSLDFTSAETGDAPWLVARVAAVNEAAARAADTPMASVRALPPGSAVSPTVPVIRAAPGAPQYVRRLSFTLGKSRQPGSSNGILIPSSAP